MSDEILVAVASATIHICVFFSWCCHTPEMNHRQKVFSILLLEVLIANFIGKCIVSLVFINVLDESHTANCQLIGFMQFFADNGGLYFLSAALMVSFGPHIPSFKKLIQVIVNPNGLQSRKHICLWCFVLIISSIPFFFDAFGHDEFRCYVINPLVLLIVYRVQVYISGVFFFGCSIYIWITLFNKRETCKNFIPLILLPAFFLAFSLPFELQDICKVLGYNTHKWDTFSIAWGHIFGPAVGIISLASFWQNTIHRRMKQYFTSMTKTVNTRTIATTERTEIQFTNSHLSSHVHLSKGTVNSEQELSPPNEPCMLLKIDTPHQNQSLSDEELFDYKSDEKNDSIPHEIDSTNNNDKPSNDIINNDINHTDDDFSDFNDVALDEKQNDFNLCCNTQTECDDITLNAQEIFFCFFQQIFDEEMTNIESIFNSSAMNTYNTKNDPNRNIIEYTKTPSNTPTNKLPTNNTNNINNNKNTGSSGDNNNGSGNGASNNGNSSNGNGDDKNEPNNNNNSDNHCDEEEDEEDKEQEEDDEEEDEEKEEEEEATDSGDNKLESFRLNPTAANYVPTQKTLTLTSQAVKSMGLNIIDMKNQIIEQQRNTIETLTRNQQHNNQHNQQQIDGLLNSCKRLLIQQQLRKEMNSNSNEDNNLSRQQKNSMKNKNKNKKKQIKSKQNKAFPEAQNKPSYNPSPYIRGKGNIFISKTITQLVANIMGGHQKDWYKYMDKSTAMQFNDHLNLNKVKIVIDYDFYDEKTQEKYYCIIEEQNKEQNKKMLKYKMIGKIFTAKNIFFSQHDEDIIIPRSSRMKFASQLQNRNDIQNLLNMQYQKIINIKWFNIFVFRSEVKMHNKQRIVLRLENEYMKKLMRDLHQSIKHKQLIPIIIFNDYNHWIEWVLIAEIIENVTIGISFKYNESNKTFKVSGIHVNKSALLEQHYLAEPKHINECRCFDDWSASYITDIDICGDLNETNNKIAVYKKQYEAFKGFVYAFIHMNNYKLLKQMACFLINHQCENESVCSSTSSLSSMSSMYHCNAT